jgi:hypothetical protein
MYNRETVCLANNRCVVGFLITDPRAGRPDEKYVIATSKENNNDERISVEVLRVSVCYKYSIEEGKPPLIHIPSGCRIPDCR